METQAPLVTPQALGLRYGLLLAVSWLLADFLIRIAGFSFMTFGIAASLGAVTVSVVWLAMAHGAFKRVNNGLMSFRQGVTIAVIMLLLSGLLSDLFNYVYLHYIDPDFVERMKAGMVEFMERNNVPDEQIEKSSAKMSEMQMGLGRALLGGLGNGLLGGLVLGMVVSAFTKRNPSEFE
ncbi:MAG: hypothetical protein NVSMB30_16280 [Hymenobacter sp.]